MKTTTTTIITSKKNLWGIVSNWARKHNRARIGWSVLNGTITVDITAPKEYTTAALNALTKLVA